MKDNNRLLMYALLLAAALLASCSGPERIIPGVRVRLGGRTNCPVSLITLSIKSGDMDLREWCEGLLKIE